MYLSKEQKGLIVQAKAEGMSLVDARKYLRGAIPINIIEREFSAPSPIEAVVITPEIVAESSADTVPVCEEPVLAVEDAPVEFKDITSISVDVLVVETQELPKNDKQSLVVVDKGTSIERGEQVQAAHSLFKPFPRRDGKVARSYRAFAAIERGVKPSPLSHCGYIDEGNFRCSAETAFGTSWCRYHYYLVYAPNTWCSDARAAFDKETVENARPIMVEAL